MPEDEPGLEPNRTEVLLPDLPTERSLDETEIQAAISWEKATNEFGTVEYKLYKSQQGSDKVLLYLPGLTGPVEQFEKQYVNQLLKSGYDVAVIRRNGTVINEKNKGSVGSAERIVLAAEKGQDHIGDLDEYGYAEWTQEMACAMESLDSRYQEIQAIGHSFGGLVGLESIRLLQEKNKRLQKPDDAGVLGKLTRFVSLSGQTGSVDRDAENDWLDQAKDYDGQKLDIVLDGVASAAGGCRMKPPFTVRKEYYEIADRLYSDDTVLPKHIDFGTVTAEGDRYFSLKQSHDMWEKIKRDGGHIRVWHNRAETPKNAHRQAELTPEAMLAMLETPTDDQRLRVIRRDNPLGPDHKSEEPIETEK